MFSPPPDVPIESPSDPQIAPTMHQTPATAAEQMIPVPPHRALVCVYVGESFAYDTVPLPPSLPAMPHRDIAEATLNDIVRAIAVDRPAVEPSQVQPIPTAATIPPADERREAMTMAAVDAHHAAFFAALNDCAPADVFRELGIPARLLAGDTHYSRPRYHQ